MSHHILITPDDGTGPAGRKARDQANFSGVRLLIAEAGFQDAEHLYRLLEESGIRYVSAASGNEVLQKAKEEYFDLILLGAEIEGNGELELVGRVRNEENPNRATPIILTHSSFREIFRAAHDAGVNELLCRPYTPAQLLSVLKKYLLEEETLIEEPAISAGFKFDPRLDTSCLWRLYQDNFGYAHDLFRLFTGSIEKELTEIRLSMQRQEWERMRALVHKIKPNFSMVGLTWINRSMQEVYDKLRAKDYDPIEQMMSGIMKDLDIYLPLVGAEQKRLEDFLKSVQDIPDST